MNRVRFGHRTDFGCTIQTSRYLPWCGSSGHTIVVAPALYRLLGGMGVEIVPASPDDDDLPLIAPPAPPDVGLPRLWANAAAGYHVAKLPVPRVGVCWRGSGNGCQGLLPSGADARDVPAPLLRALVAMKGITWVGLQLAPQGDELDTTINLNACRVRDFADTAGIIQQLDLVISVCTSVAHLAASLGVPTWVLSSATDQLRRWHLYSTGPMPFYPTVRIIDQAVAGEWEPVVAELGERLADAFRVLPSEPLSSPGQSS